MDTPTEIKSKYAQLASSVINQYDASLIFYEVKPIQLNKDDIQKFKPSIEEVVRITLPHRTLKELHELLTKQISEMEAKKGEDKTIADLKRKAK